jgi:hypothetical protein
MEMLAKIRDDAMVAMQRPKFIEDDARNYVI